MSENQIPIPGVNENFEYKNPTGQNFPIIGWEPWPRVCKSYNFSDETLKALTQSLFTKLSDMGIAWHTAL